MDEAFFLFDITKIVFMSNDAINCTQKMAHIAKSMETYLIGTQDPFQ